MDSFVLKTSTSEKKKRKISQLNSIKDSTPSKEFNKKN